MNVTLIGMAGAGKSHIGKLLAERLAYRFLDIDREMEKEAGIPLRAILDSLGDTGFIEAETDAIVRLTQTQHGLCISPGGSIIYSPRAMEHLKTISKIAYLEVPFTVIEERVGKEPRGIVGLGDRSLFEIYDERTVLYKKYADAVFQNVGDTDETVTRIIETFSL